MPGTPSTSVPVQHQRRDANQVVGHRPAEIRPDGGDGPAGQRDRLGNGHKVRPVQRGGGSFHRHLGPACQRNADVRPAHGGRIVQAIADKQGPPERGREPFAETARRVRGTKGSCPLSIPQRLYHLVLLLRRHGGIQRRKLRRGGGAARTVPGHDAHGQAHPLQCLHRRLRAVAQMLTEQDGGRPLAVDARPDCEHACIGRQVTRTRRTTAG